MLYQKLLDFYKKRVNYIKMNHILNHNISFKPNSSFSERESLINNEVLKINDTLRQRGFYPINHKILNKNDKTAHIEIIYKA